ncbi:hypothetical protein ABK040_015421 [Willaertia magna]
MSNKTTTSTMQYQSNEEKQIAQIRLGIQTSISHLLARDAKKYDNVVQNFPNLNAEQLNITFKALIKIPEDIIKAYYSDVTQNNLLLVILGISTKVLCGNNKDLQSTFDNLMLTLATKSTSSNRDLTGSKHVQKESILSAILTFCIEQFVPLAPFQVSAIEAQTKQQLSPEQVKDMEEIKKQNVHNLLYKLSKKVSGTSFYGTLKKALQTKYPTAISTLLDHKEYVNNLFIMTKYIPSLCSHSFSLIVQHLIEMDAQLVALNATESVEEDENAENIDIENAVFDLELNEENIEETRIYCAEKLDTVITVVFETIEKRIKENNAKDFLDSIFNAMMDLFKNFVLNQYQLHSIQFLMFYICSHNVDYMDKFAGFLLNNIFNTHLNPDVRKCCAAYLSGLIARANYVTNTTILRVLGQLFNWSDKYIQTFEQSVTFIDVSSHSLFYAVCQGALYIVCFKLKQLLKPEGKDINQLIAESRQFFAQSPITRIVHSRFNPLKVIAQDVAEEAVNIFSQYYLFDFHQVIERNQSIVIPQLKGDGNDFLETNFFPFDPYLLRRSEKYITPIYQRWEGGFEPLSNHQQIFGSPSKNDFHSVFNNANDMDRFRDSQRNRTKSDVYLFEYDNKEEDEMEDEEEDSECSESEEENEFDEFSYYDASGSGNGRSPPKTIAIKKKNTLSGVSGMSIGSGSFDESPFKHHSPYGWNAISLSPHI